jgi:SAM-dependent methyltransferase
MSLELHTPLLGEAVAGEPFVASIPLTVHAPLLLAPDLQLVLEESASGAVAWIGRLGEEVQPQWLPRGTYFVRWLSPALALAAGRYRLRAVAIGAHAERAEASVEFELTGSLEGGPLSGAWQLESAEDSPPLEGLSWRHGSADAFAERFDRAPEQIITRLLRDAPQLGGRVLELGCGDGDLALGLALRCRPVSYLALDREAGRDRLEALLPAQHIPLDAIPATLRFERLAGGSLPLADGGIDLALCWARLGDLESGGDDMLRELRRVLAADGLLCLQTRAAEIAPSVLEQRLRQLDFEPVRACVRCESMVDYDDDSRERPLADLALTELRSLWRKRRT